ncbi:MAG: peptidoglycan DD-metalloendopeptidase family protein [Oscillospiraceae bacterium]|nr:peptidoglycan DD-metalloendopeptidase family protein [Oscillospiraceae bacterium]
MKKRNIFRSVVIFLFVFCLLATDLTPIALVGEVSAITQADIDKLKKESDALANEKKKVEQELAALKKDKNSTLKHKSLLDQQISLLSSEIENTEEQIGKYEQLIVQTAAELSDAQLQEEAQYELFCKRVRAMEERGSISYWSVLFDAASFAELLSEIDFINEIMEADRRVIDDLQLLQQEISQKQAELEISLAEQEAAKESLAEKNASLRTQRTEANNLIKQIMENEEEYKATLDEIEAEEERTQQEIVRLSRELAAQQGNTKETYGGYIWPVTTSKRVTSPVGSRYTGIPGASTNHRGIDIGGVYWNSTVYAAKSGTVIVSGYNNVRGNYIVISHGSGNTTTYQHLSKRLVSVNAVVKQGDKIGITGSSGVGSGPHLHFEITEKGQLVDPLKYLTDYVKAWR